ncbi:MAG: hypothetical protein AAFS10_14865 [Myxococcota bacterium]
MAWLPMTPQQALPSSTLHTPTSQPDGGAPTIEVMLHQFEFESVAPGLE